MERRLTELKREKERLERKEKHKNLRRKLDDVQPLKLKKKKKSNGDKVDAGALRGMKEIQREVDNLMDKNLGFMGGKSKSKSKNKKKGKGKSSFSHSYTTDSSSSCETSDDSESSDESSESSDDEER